MAFYSLVLHECGFERYCCVAPAVSSTVKSAELCLVLRLGLSQPFCSVILAGALHSVFSTGCQTRPVGFESKISRMIRFIRNFLVVLVLHKYPSLTESPGLWSFQLDEAALGSMRLQLCTRQLHNWDLNIKKGKISKASPKKHAVIHTAFVLLGVCTYTHIRTL